MTNKNTWKTGMDLPYVVPLGDGGMLAILLRAPWLKADKSGRPLLLPPAVRALDRLRAVFSKERIAAERTSPGFIVSLREAMSLTQKQFGRKLGVSKMTVSRWERGKMRPSRAAAAAIDELRSRARREGVRIAAEAAEQLKRPA